MPSIQKLLSDFCLLTKRQKTAQLADYQKKLDAAYADGDRKIILGASALGLQNPGGLLLGEFLKRHPDIEEVRVPGNMFYSPLSPSETTGLQAFIAGLAETKTAGKLRVLDLSGSAYLPEHLGELAQKVIANHPSLETLTLNSTELTDEHLAAMLPYLSSPTLQVINLRYNQLLGANFSTLTEQLLTACPALNLLDLTANDIPLENASPLRRLLIENRKVFVRINGNTELRDLSIRNHYDFFVPSRISIMMRQFDALEAKFGQFEIRINALPENPEDTGARAQIRQLEARLGQMTEQMEANQGNILHQMLNQEIVQTARMRTFERDMTLQSTRIDTLGAQFLSQQNQLEQLRQLSESTQVQIREMETRLSLTETEDRALSADILKLKQMLAQHSESIEILEDAFEIIKELQAGLDALKKQSEEEPFSPDSIAALSDLSPEQQAYVERFKKILVRMHMTAMIVSTGLVKVSASGGLGKAGQVLNAVSSCVPLGAGMGVKMLAYCLQAADHNVVMRRMDRLSRLGDAPDEVARLSEQLSLRLVRCLTIENTVKEHHMAKLLSATGDVLESMVESGFYGALTQVFEMAVDPLIDQVIDTTDLSVIEKRAEQDAQLLLAAIAESDVLDGRVRDMHRLFLYAVPMLTVVDSIFYLLIDQFCQQQTCERDKLEINTKKRAQFYGHMTNSWHRQAAFVGEALEDETHRRCLITDVAQGFASKPHADGSIGVFYFKESKGMTIFSGIANSKRHASWNKTALLSETADEVMTAVIARSGK